MANKVATKERKVTAKKSTSAATAAKSKAGSSKMNKGDAYQCEICGLQVYVDEMGEVLETTGLYCCSEAMKKAGATKSSRTKASNTKASKK